MIVLWKRHLSRYLSIHCGESLSYRQPRVQVFLELAKSCLFGEVPQTLGKMKYLCASVNAKHGKRLSEQEMVRVELLLDGGIEYLDVLRTQGSRASSAKDSALDGGSIPPGRGADSGRFGSRITSLEPDDSQ